MFELTPFECFLAGIAVAGLGLAVLGFFLRRSVVEHRKQFPHALEVIEEGMRSRDQHAPTLHQRLQQIEMRLSELEQQIGR